MSANNDSAKRGIPIGTYGVRTLPRAPGQGPNAEKIFHAHHSAEGRYDLLAYPDGSFVYVPVKKKGVME